MQHTLFFFLLLDLCATIAQHQRRSIAHRQRQPTLDDPRSIAQRQPTLEEDLGSMAQGTEAPRERGWRVRRATGRRVPRAQPEVVDAMKKPEEPENPHVALARGLLIEGDRQQQQPTLEDLAYKFGTDKGHDDHKYTDLYNALFEPRRGWVKNVTEIGIALGS